MDGDGHAGSDTLVAGRSAEHRSGYELDRHSDAEGAS